MTQWDWLQIDDSSEPTAPINFKEFTAIVRSCEPGDDRLKQISVEYPTYWRWYCQNMRNKIYQTRLTAQSNSV